MRLVGCVLVCFAMLTTACGSRSGLTCDLLGCDELAGGGSADTSVTESDATIGFDFDVGTDTGSARDTGGRDTGPSTVCRPVLPMAGAACVPPLDCAYVGCDLSEKDRAVCVGGKWVINAAPCVEGPKSCPLAIPETGTYCALPDHTGCTWSTDCVGSVVGWCEHGIWEVKRGWCRDDGSCPPSLPANGTKCSSGPGVCNYLNECGVPQLAMCHDEAWLTLPSDCTLHPECPASEPPSGSACEPGSRPMCVWKNDCGGINYGKCGWYLGEGQWTIFRPPCPAPACPDTAPSGSSCALEGQSCAYPAGRGCTLSCSCSSGSWLCAKDCST